MRKILIIMLLLTQPMFGQKYVLKIDSALHYRAYEVIKSQIGVTEKTGNNDGEVEKYLKVVGLRKGYPYCAAGISWSYLEAAKQLKYNKKIIPFPITASSQVVYDYAKKYGKLSYSDVEWMDMFIWRQKDSYSGHICVVEKKGRKGWVNTIEFNTSSNSTGNQRDGGGVFRKSRNLIHPLGKMMVRGFVGFKYK